MVKPNPPGGVLDGSRHYYAVRVYYEDTDLSGITYHANYLRWFERARSDLLRMLNIDQRAAIEAGAKGEGGGAYAVTQINIKYVSPAKLDDDVVIETTATQVGAASVRMEQVARRDGDILATAEVRAGFLTPEGRPRRQPAEWVASFKDFIDAKGR